MKMHPMSLLRESTKNIYKLPAIGWKILSNFFGGKVFGKQFFSGSKKQFGQQQKIGSTGHHFSFLVYNRTAFRLSDYYIWTLSE